MSQLQKLPPKFSHQKTSGKQSDKILDHDFVNGPTIDFFHQKDLVSSDFDCWAFIQNNDKGLTIPSC